MKWLFYLVLTASIAGGWMFYSRSGGETKVLQAKVDALENAGIYDVKEHADLISKIDTRTNEKLFSGIVLAFLTAGLVGMVVVVDLLPMLAHKATHSVYDSGEKVSDEADAMHAARSKVAQGDYEGAIESYREAAKADPLNRLPWVEIAKIQRENLEDPAAAIQTIRHALESQEWEVNNAAYFLFRLAELYDEDAGDRVSAATMLNQVIEQFPETRHSANARHKLHEWGLI
jgi:tetratricopeptide (TPR) repeat protein